MTACSANSICAVARVLFSRGCAIPGYSFKGGVKTAAIMDTPVPARRPLQIYALDPMRLDDSGEGFVTPRATLSVPYEQLSPGPIGKRIQVIDYDGTRNVFYQPVNLDDPHLLITNGLTPTETDPRFHQQMAYAVAASVWDACEAAMGRRIGVSGGALRIFPHAFYGDNAYFDPRLNALLLGYFQADDDEPGPNLPGQMVFTCLSHDIVAHETAHAVVDRLRPYFDDATNDDVLAFHEAFADLVAIFQHFEIDQVLVDAINQRKADLTSADAISGLARQFGFAAAQRAPLRSAFDESADPAALARTTEPHARGLILVQAVFDAYRTTYLARVQDLLRLASGGSGILPEGRPHPDLVHRMAREASTTARQFFTRCVQAFSYLPPLDVTFGDFLRALVTADAIASPSDDSFRTAVIEGFRRRGIYASDAGSMAASAIEWPIQHIKDALPLSVEGLPARTAEALGEHSPLSDDENESQAKIARELHEWAEEHAAELGLAPQIEGEPGARPIEVVGFHSTFRIDANGQPFVDTVVQFVQARHDLEDVDPNLAGIVPKAGVTVVADARRRVRYVLAKPLPGSAADAHNQRGEQRLKQLVDVAKAFDRANPAAAYRADGRGRLRVNFARLHAGFYGTSDA